ncbi:MAG: DUF2207 domain-containing protein [Candidatus Altiarchaeota archaeon]|nr:DUF2207 domain-containing protein [Candidatus Altiarchaeota archaeon]
MKKDIISLEEAREIREQLRPAFAGYVTDGNVSDRDVLATLMDLIVRGHIGIDMESQKKPVKVKKVYFLSNPETLLPFERRFIEVLFSESKELSPEKVRRKLLSGELHKVIRENLSELENAKIVKSRLLFYGKDLGYKTIKYKVNRGEVQQLDSKGIWTRWNEGKEARYSWGIAREIEVKTIGDLEDYRCYLNRSLAGGAFIILFVLFFCSVSILAGFTLYYLTPVPWAFVLIGGFFLFAGASVLVSAIKRRLELKGVKKLLLFQFANNVVPFTKRKYEDLFDFIQKYPLKQQRLYNEFMPHAVAFGLDTSWNESFGIPEETVVSSRAVSQLSPGEREKFGDLE